MLVASLLLMGLGAVSFLVRWLTLYHAPHAEDIWRYSTPGNFVFFIPGMLLAFLQVRWERQPPSWLRGLAAASTTWLLASVGFWLIVFWHYSWEVAILAATFSMVGACVLPLRSGLPVRLLEWRPLAVLGIASYSLYLWHFPIVMWLARATWMPRQFLPQLAIVAPLCIVIALLSYAVIEAPFLRLRSRWAPSTLAAEVAPGGIRPVLRPPAPIAGS
jgi:peptidoglycan/LPS O-acetylase OafA/YrhL